MITSHFKNKINKYDREDNLRKKKSFYYRIEHNNKHEKKGYKILERLLDEYVGQNINLVIQKMKEKHYEYWTKHIKKEIQDMRTDIIYRRYSKYWIDDNIVYKRPF